MKGAVALVVIVLIIIFLKDTMPIVLWTCGALAAVFIVRIIVKAIKKRRMEQRLAAQYTVDYDFYTKLAGVTFNGIQSILPTLHAGMPIEFRRESHNAYDENAILAICGGKKIGYLSADIAGELAPIMDAGTPVTGTIRDITGGYLGKSYGCNVDVVVYKPKDQKSVPTAPAIKISELTRQVECVDESNPLYDKQCAVFGTNKALAAQCIIDLGGVVKSSVNDETDYVIALNPDWLNGRSANAAKAREIISSGGGKLKVLNAEEFDAIKDKFLVK